MLVAIVGLNVEWNTSGSSYKCCSRRHDAFGVRARRSAGRVGNDGGRPRTLELG